MKKEIEKFISYFFVGGIAALVEWSVFALFNSFTNYLIATIIAFIIATTVNYFLGKRWTFKNYEKNNKDVIAVFIVSGIGLLLNMLFMYILVDMIKLSYKIIDKIISTGLVFIWNYLSRRMFIYKKEID